MKLNHKFLASKKDFQAKLLKQKDFEEKMKNMQKVFQNKMNQFSMIIYQKEENAQLKKGNRKIKAREKMIQNQS